MSHEVGASVARTIVRPTGFGVGVRLLTLHIFKTASVRFSLGRVEAPERFFTAGLSPFLYLGVLLVVAELPEPKVDARGTRRDQRV